MLLFPGTSSTASRADEIDVSTTEQEHFIVSRYIPEFGAAHRAVVYSAGRAAEATQPPSCPLQLDALAITALFALCVVSSTNLALPSWGICALAKERILEVGRSAQAPEVFTRHQVE